MDNSISQLIRTLDMARTTDDVEQIINRIADSGESAIPELLQYEKTLYRQPSGYKSVMRIYQLMGYPANRSAIPTIVSQASSMNSPGCEIALAKLARPSFEPMVTHISVSGFKSTPKRFL